MNPQEPGTPSREIIVARRPQPVDDESADFSVETLPEPVSLRERLAVVRRHYPVVIGVAAVAIAVAAFAVSRTVPSFRAVSTVRFNDSRSNLTAGVGTSNASAFAWSVDPIKSQMELLKSRATAEEAVDKGKLQVRALSGPAAIDAISALDASKVQHADTLKFAFSDSSVAIESASGKASGSYGSPLSIDGIAITLASRPTVSSARLEVVPREDAIGFVQAGLNASRRADTDITDLTFESPDPDLARRVVNAATLSFQTLNMRASQEVARSRREFLESQLRKTDSVLEAQRGQLSAFRSATQAFSSKDKIAAAQQSLTSIELRRGELQADSQMYQSLLTRAVQARQSGDPNALKTLMSAPGIAANPVLTQIYGDLAQLKKQRDSLTTGPYASSATNPDVQRVNALITSTSDDLVAAVRSQIEGIDARIASLQTLGSRSAAEVSSLPQSEAEEARLLQQADGTEKMAEQLREEQQKARISEVAQGGQVEIIDLARTPQEPINAGGSRKVIFAGLLGLFLGCALALLIEGMSTTLRRADEVERTLRLPTLGVIPKLGRTENGTTRKRLPSKSRALSKPHKYAIELVNPEVPAFESFRSLRTSLIFSNAVQTLRTMVITSAAPGDGKSTTTANLAAAFAQQGMKVLAVDCDLRRGHLHGFFGKPREPGLTNVVLGQLELEAAISPTAVPGLSILTSGVRPPNASELLGSEPFRQILLQAVATHDLVILDSPPVLATSDAAVLSSMADGVVVLVRMGATDRQAARRALQRLEVVGARVLGTVLNDPDDILGSAEEYYYSYAASDA